MKNVKNSINPAQLYFHKDRTLFSVNAVVDHPGEGPKLMFRERASTIGTVEVSSVESKPETTRRSIDSGEVYHSTTTPSSKKESKGSKDSSFLTGSRYDGNYREDTRTMDGFGDYVYPDGSEYRGYFKNGKFHGFGRLHLAYPYRTTYKGEFENGVLTKIEDICFGDGLHCVAELKDNAVNFNKWKYCKDDDRRFYGEIRTGMQAVGPESYLTNSRPSREIPASSYDTEEGFFMKTGFIGDVPKPFADYRYVGCANESDWIKTHCRKSHDLNTYEDCEYPCTAVEKFIEPSSEVCRSIIKSNNNASEFKSALKPHKCLCHNRTAVYPHLQDICRQSEANSNEPRLYHSMDSTSYSSFSDNSLIEPVSAQLKCSDLNEISANVVENLNENDNLLTEDNSLG